MASWLPVWLILSLAAICFIWSIYRWVAVAAMVGTIRIAASPLAPAPYDLAALAGSHQPVTIDAEVLSPPTKYGYAQQLVAWGRAGKNSGRLLVKVPAQATFRPGDLITIRGMLERPARLSEFDYPAWLAKDGIFTVMRRPAIQPNGHRVTLARLGYGFRESFKTGLRRVFPEPSSGFLLGITIGEQSALPDHLVQAFRRTGTSHVLVLSGYNISIVLAVVIGLIGRRRAAIGLALLALAGFVVIVGPSAAVIRAAVMGGLLLLAAALGRPQQALAACVITAGIMLLASPWSARYDLGFSLSFLATIGILLFEAPLRRRLHRLPRLVRDPVAATLAASVTTAPVIVANFGYLSPVAPAANLLVVPTVPWLMLGATIATLLGSLSTGLALGLAAAINWVVSGVLSGVSALAELPHAAINVSAWRPAVLAVLILAVAVFSRRAVANL